MSCCKNCVFGNYKIEIKESIKVSEYLFCLGKARHIACEFDIFCTYVAGSEHTDHTDSFKDHIDDAKRNVAG